MQRKLTHTFGAVGWCAAVLFSSTPGRAEGSAYCRKVQARAAGDAALLYSPSVQAQGIKFPRNGTTDSGVTTGLGYQFRAGASFSPLDFYKGTRVERVGEADCEQHEVATTARDVLLQGPDFGRYVALKKQVEFLDAHRAECDAIASKSAESVAAHVGSLRDSAEVQSRLVVLMRAREQSQGDADRLAARGITAWRGSLSALVASAEAAAMKFEREASHVRSLDAWDFKVSGGVIPQDKPVDFFGIVQVGFNFGAFERNANETRYLQARAEELASTRHELRDEIRVFRAQVASAEAQAKRELVIIERHAATLAADKDALEHADASNAVHALALIALDSILIESDRVYLKSLIAELARLENDHV